MSSAAVILWFRQDLRLSDNPALSWAARQGPVVPVYVLDDDTPGDWRIGGAGRWWLHHSLSALTTSLEEKGLTLILRRGEAAAEIEKLVDEVGAGAVAWNRCYEPFAIERDKALKTTLKDKGIEVESFNAGLLAEPWEILKDDGDPYRVYSPYWRALQARGDPEPALNKPREIETPKNLPESDALDDWALLPTEPDWAGGLRESWTPGEEGARQRLQNFLDTAIDDYGKERDRPDLDSVSGLSPHLHWGEIGPRQIWHIVRGRMENDKAKDKSAFKFLSEIAWREFSYYLLYHFPTLPHDNFNARFDDFPWEHDEEALKRWQRGKTGYPLVDAGMRQLWQTGYMHNRVRMVVGSFLVKDLRLHWRCGEDWFWDTLCDADLANNSASWQWVAGSGADAAPYFRIFNPVKQSQKFDPNGNYIRRFVPELTKLPDEHIHAPWEAPAEVLDAAGVELGSTYPEPMVDHSKARQIALEAFEEIKKAA